MVVWKRQPSSAAYLEYLGDVPDLPFEADPLEEFRHALNHQGYVTPEPAWQELKRSKPAGEHEPFVREPTKSEISQRMRRAGERLSRELHAAKVHKFPPKIPPKPLDPAIAAANAEADKERRAQYETRKRRYDEARAAGAWEWDKIVEYANSHYSEK